MIAFNETTVAAQKTEPGVVRQELLTNERVKDTKVLLSRLTLAAGATVRFELPAKSLAWLQMLDGEGTLETLYKDRLSDSHSALLPPGSSAALSSDKGASLLYAEIPDAGRIDPGFLAAPPIFTVTDWMREPVLKSKSDARKRVALVTPEMCQTEAIKVQMVIYPPGSTASQYHHEGADSFVYIVSGRGAAWGNEGPSSAQQGDLIYFPDRERHRLKAADDSEMRFLIFYVPGNFSTVWADRTDATAWVSTNRDIHGWETAKDRKERLAYSRAYGGPLGT
jgi:quercetin dioxygenase-like cupin family protein